MPFLVKTSSSAFVPINAKSSSPAANQISFICLAAAAPLPKNFGNDCSMF